MIPSRNYVKPTALEQVRTDAARKSGCLLSMLRTEKGLFVPQYGRVEIHHLKDGNRVLGHLYTICLHSWYHRAVPPPGMRRDEAREFYGASIADGSKAFLESHGLTERDLWLEHQKRIGGISEFPPSKIYKRSAA
jgi:hypothetical protein